MKEDPHVQLMLRFQRGDEKAFYELYEAYKSALLNFAYRFCQDRRIAEELSHEVFLRVYKTAATYRPEAKFSTWVYRIATNICLNEMRSGKYTYEREFFEWQGTDKKRGIEPVDPKTRKKTDDNIIEREKQKAVRAAISMLPEKQRMALLLNVYEQLSYKEIGQRISCSEGAVKSIIHRAKLALKDYLKKKWKREYEQEV